MSDRELLREIGGSVAIGAVAYFYSAVTAAICLVATFGGFDKSTLAWVFDFAVAIGLISLVPFAITKFVIHIAGWDGPVAHAASGALVGFLASFFVFDWRTQIEFVVPGLMAGLVWWLVRAFFREKARTLKKELMGRPLESSPLLRILAVGWGTMVGTTLLVFLRLMDGPVGQSNMFEVGLHSLGYGSAFAILISIPVLAFWSRIYPRISFAVRSSKTAACLTAAMTAAIGMLVLGLLIGIGSASFIGGLNVVLVWGLAPVALAATLAWFAFKSEQFTGGQ